MPYERPLRASDSSRPTASRGHRIVAGQQHLELVDDAEDPRHRLAAALLGRHRAQIGEPGDAGPLVGHRAPGHLRVQLAQHGQAVLPVGLDADRPGVRQPGAVPLGRHELGERHALLEVEQVERQLVGAVPGAEPVQHVDQEGGLAGAGPAAHHPVWSQVVEPQHQRGVTVVARPIVPRPSAASPLHSSSPGSGSRSASVTWEAAAEWAASSRHTASTRCGGGSSSRKTGAFSQTRVRHRAERRAGRVADHRVRVADRDHRRPRQRRLGGLRGQRRRRPARHDQVQPRLGPLLGQRGDPVQLVALGQLAAGWR